MNDRELLELAATAAGVTSNGLGDCYDYEYGAVWNPLVDDGCALRLAVKLAFCITQWFTHEPPDTMVGYNTPDGKGRNWIKDHNGDPYAATRRAIVRAAAEIGKAMP